MALMLAYLKVPLTWGQIIRRTINESIGDNVLGMHLPTEKPKGKKCPARSARSGPPGCVSGWNNSARVGGEALKSLRRMRT
jgi:hypothetical protein